ncbi:type II toxin-antitoxin system CcdA family antitoxin [Rahnella sp. AA]|uniref:type II toxin-antitoxin system CcdA family antitoxin n=1 Tax=Rahnella sp. AA TaxID=2057180 RepID=UPI0012FE921F|nr:type II toxin-antitoxin system CcdA family antitoxin [Rahnella sp. AA]
MSKGNKKDFKVSAEHPVEETAGEKWKRENKAGLEAIKKYVEKHGTLTHPPRKL